MIKQRAKLIIKLKHPIFQGMMRILKVEKTQVKLHIIIKGTDLIMSLRVWSLDWSCTMVSRPFKSTEGIRLKLMQLERTKSNKKMAQERRTKNSNTLLKTNQMKVQLKQLKITSMTSTTIWMTISLTTMISALAFKKKQICYLLTQAFMPMKAVYQGKPPIWSKKKDRNAKMKR